MLVGFAGNCNTVASWPSHKKVRRKKGLPVRQFERVMVHMRLVTIDLAENCRLVPSGGGSSVDCDFRIEGKLRAGKHANRGAGIARSGEPARAGAEITRSKLVANARGTRTWLLCSTSVASNARSRAWFIRWTASMSGLQHMVLNLSGWQRDSRPRASIRTSAGGISQSIGWLAIRMTVSKRQFWQNEPN